MMLGADGEKLSKRHGAVSVGEYRDDGIPAERAAQLPRRASAGRTATRRSSRCAELIAEVRLGARGRPPGVFNPQKLEWLNQQWIKKTPPEELAKATGSPREFVVLMQERARNLNEIRDAYRAYIAPEMPAYDEKAVAKQLTAETKPLLAEARGVIEEKFAEGPQGMEHAFRALADLRGLGLGKLAQPVRVAVTGTTVSPPLFETIQLLGKERTLRRIDAALEKIG